ncbi:MAG: MBL fold metallo-hydrolase [Clostridia bacterium]|nr:MBL fold metallo-hydrolase [Clostridia bacterium]
MRLENYHTSENCYIVINEAKKEAFVVDPGYDAEKIMIAAENIKISHILITHCHYDHISGLEKLREITGAKLVASALADSHAQNPKINLSVAFSEQIKTKPAEIVVSDGEIINICGFDIKCIFTPGHTSCSTCFLCENHLFTGDTLFLREVGRWDLPTGNEDELILSIKNKLYKLDDSLTVHPGHGEDSSIGYEKKYNFYVKEQ